MPKQTHTFIPQPGTFCKAIVAIPSGVSTASYSQHSRESGYGDSVIPESRLCYVRGRLGNTFSVHFCTGFGGRDITTQFYDHPEKRNRFLALAPTPSHNEHAALGTENGWDRTPAYICLYPAIQVTMTRTRKASHPVPNVPSEERARLDDLIDTLAMMDLPGAADEDDHDDKDSEEEHKKGEEEHHDDERYDKDFPSGGMVASGSKRSAPRYSCSSAVQHWAYEVAGIESNSSQHGDGAASRDDDDWSQVSGFSPQDFLAAREDRIEQVHVIFSDDLNDVIMTEEDPAGMFLREARHFGSITVL
ncbi:hypothetical protein HDU87_002047 [Geranomyces variabilis]|uniref:Uncharacterized protein n=1 Tax=Geranomyces variabilis TaxID=109894 RepID=A0AAD5TP93_9FUNG|nr:hypothetical protein HDU87_002047 [Geranomyces variabilis]